MRTRSLLTFAAVLATSLSLAGSAAAASTTVVVDENNEAGWQFGRDAANATPYHFSTVDGSIGSGSLYVEPIGATPAHKFIGELTVGAPVSELESVSFDFDIENGGAAAQPYEHFYLNVYTNLPGSSTFYDCRFDYVAGGDSGGWNTVTAAAAGVPTAVAPRGGASCPATLGEMPAGSTISVIAVNVGQSSASDVGVSGYLDNVVVRLGGAETIYDFEATPATKDDCKDGGWAAYGFRNQGECVSSLMAGGRSGK